MKLSDPIHQEQQVLENKHGKEAIFIRIGSHFNSISVSNLGSKKREVKEVNKLLSGNGPELQNSRILTLSPADLESVLVFIKTHKLSWFLKQDSTGKLKSKCA